MRQLCSLCLLLAFSAWAYGQNQDAGYDFLYKKPPELKAAVWLNAKKPPSLKKLAKDKKVVIVEFMTTTCPHCIPIVPKMKEIHDKYSKEDVVLIAVTCEDPKAVAKWVKDQSIPYPVAVDKEQNSIGPYGVSGVPYIYIIGKNGVVAWQNWGQALDDDALGVALAAARATAEK